MGKKIFAYWLPVVAWCSLIFVLSSVPNLKTELGFWDLVLRKAAHMFEYGVLFLLSFRAFAASAASTNRAYIFGIVFSIAYAFSDEFHQAFVPTRGPSMVDVAIDSMGVFLGFIIRRKINERDAI